MQKRRIVQTLIVLLISVHSTVSAQLNPKDAISQMKKGINLGNTLEPPTEGEWGNPPTQEYLFDMYKNAGFDFVRIPVRWDNHFGTTSPFKINETWFQHVEQIIDWGLSKGLYIIVNSHHDNWIKTGYSDPVNRARFDSLWSQIAVRFKDKPEKLIFEICNEPVNMSKAITDELHQKAINIIRKTNPTRLIIFQGTDWGSSDGLINAAIPNDKYLIGSFHTYDPYPFGLLGTGTFTSTDANNLKAKFQAVKNWSVKNNIPVILGEFGGVSKCEYNSRMKQYKTYVELCETFGFACCAWEDGGEFKFINRSAQTWFDDIKDILVNSSLQSPKLTKLEIVQDTIIRIDWTNTATNYDSIYIERRSATTTFKRIAALKGNVATYSEDNLKGNNDYYYRVIAHYNNSKDLYSLPQKIFLPFSVIKDRKPYTGQAFDIPGKIEAENFDIGGEGFTYHDSDLKNVPAAYRTDEGIDILDKGNGTYLVTDNYSGEWMEYTVNVAETGLYDISTATAAFAGGGTFKIKIGANESEIITAPTTYSWYNTKTVKTSLNLEAGKQIMRLTIVDKPLFNIDYLEFTRNTTATIQSLSNNQFNILQNSNALIFNSNDDKNIENIKIYNILGAIVKTVQKPGTNLRISTRELHPGVYIVQLCSGNQKISKKVIIQ